MMHSLKDVSLDQVVIEHYLFSLGYPVEKVSEIFDMDEKSVREIYDNYKRYTSLEYNK